MTWLRNISCKQRFNKTYADKARHQPEVYLIGAELGFHGTASCNMPNISKQA